MTNFEQWKSLGISEFIEKINQYYKCDYNEFVDLEAYFQGDKDNFSEYLKVKYYAKFKPSDMDISVAKANAKMQGESFDEETYIAEHIKTFPVLRDDRIIFNTKYATVFDTYYEYSSQLMQIPLSLMIEKIKR